jgi:hypothetical protein
MNPNICYILDEKSLQSVRRPGGAGQLQMISYGQDSGEHVRSDNSAV